MKLVRSFLIALSIADKLTKGKLLTPPAAAVTGSAGSAEANAADADTSAAAASTAASVSTASSPSVVVLTGLGGNGASDCALLPFTATWGVTAGGCGAAAGAAGLLDATAAAACDLKYGWLCSADSNTSKASLDSCRYSRS